MRIALVFDGLGFGGIERVGIQYTKILLALGYQVDVYNLKESNSDLEMQLPKSCGMIHSTLPDALLPYQYMYMVKRWWWGKYLYPAAFLISKCGLLTHRKLRKRERYDIVIAFSGHMRDLTFVAHDYLRAEKKVAWLHGALIDYLLLSPSFGDLYSKIKNLVVLSRDRQVNALEACSYLRPRLNINQLYNPIDLQDKPSSPHVVTQLRHRFGTFILSVGRLDTDKDQATIIRAAKVLKTDYAISWPIVFVGDGPCRTSLEKLVADYNLSNMIFFEGSRENVQDYYSAAALFVHSSPTEGLPTVILEAMKYGVPVVATKSQPGVPEIADKNDCLALCSVGDERGMAKKIAQLASSENLRNEYRKRGEIRVQDFSVEHIETELAEILSSLK